MSASKLGIYNKALRHIGERKLATLSDNQETRRTLDDFWDLDFFLAQGLWRFARRTVKLEYSPSIEPPFGYSRAFNHPDDFIRVAEVCSDEFFTAPLREYKTEAGFWFSDLDTIYVSYISNDSAYGGDLSLWLPNFEYWVESWLALQICPRITGKESYLPELIKQEKTALRTARSRDVMESPTKMPVHGSWVMSRSSRSNNRLDSNRDIPT